MVELRPFRKLRWQQASASPWFCDIKCAIVIFFNLTHKLVPTYWHTNSTQLLYQLSLSHQFKYHQWGRRGSDRMLPGFITTYAISAIKVVSLNPVLGEVYSIQLMWPSLSATCNKSVVFSGYCTNKTDRHDITKILLKVVSNIITLIL